MDTFWIILTIVIIGSLIIGAINKNTQTKVALAEQEKQDKLNSPEYQAQATASLDYFKYVNDVLDWKVWIAEAEIQLYDPPLWIHIYDDPKTGKTLDKTYCITPDKEAYDQNKKDADIRLVSKEDFLKTIKFKIQDHKKTLNEVEAEYQGKRKEHSGYKPENLEVIRTKYELDVPFPSDMDDRGHGYLNEDNTSSWSMYEERKAKLQELEHTLKLLRDPKTRKQALRTMEDGQKVKSDDLNDDELLQEAVRVVVEGDQASASLLQRRLRIGYVRAARLIEEMEQRGIVGAADGIKPRKVLASGDYKVE